jgi:hypothetical protein
MGYNSLPNMDFHFLTQASQLRIQRVFAEKFPKTLKSALAEHQTFFRMGVEDIHQLVTMNLHDLSINRYPGIARARAAINHLNLAEDVPRTVTAIHTLTGFWVAGHKLNQSLSDHKHMLAGITHAVEVFTSLGNEAAH